ncbi:sensor histidine kinase [Streptomyces ficellus]|uniref:histidine kinase n=1 Tax=Streptomyces ficellus TaxID=1977088 RepID=A0A6I6F841_9ACTN|nr:HAMP domain-containing sensor histidine kinase [Streptomyces ficellus]QGV77177.1 sensor histidine kinase [Streptomyces ficellus]
MTRRLLLSHLTVALLVLLCLEVPLGIFYSRAEQQHATRAAGDEAESLAAFAAVSLEGRRTAALRSRVAHCAERVGGDVFVFGPEGRLMASSRPLTPTEAREMAGRREVRSALRGRAAVDLREGTAGGGVRVPAAAAPVPLGPDRFGAVRVVLPADMVHRRIHGVWLTLAVVGLVALVAVAGVAFWLARWTSRPVLELERATARLAEGDLSVRATLATSTGPPEVRRLAVTFNETAARLEHLLASQRAFAGEASHQLKTPLAALRLRLDNLEPDVADHARGGLAAAMTETERLARMVEGLLAMARLDEKAVMRVPVDLDRVALDRVQTWAPVFEERGCRLALGVEHAGQALAVPGAVEQILDNLLSNALRVSPSGSVVLLDRRLPRPARRSPRDHRAPWAELHVVDEGPGMPPEHRERAFDRFWRAPGSTEGGSGLGLPLVQRLAVASGGHVVLEEAARGGIDAVVRLPSIPSRGGPGHPSARAESRAESLLPWPARRTVHTPRRPAPSVRRP